MNFRLITLLWVFAVLAAGMGTFGPAGGLFASALVLLGWFLTSRAGLLGCVLYLVGGLMLTALLLPAVSSARSAACRNMCMNNQKQILLALLNYESTHGALPPAFTVDAEGKPLHSWRVLILPFIEQQKLYSQIKLDEPWDSPSNRKLADQMPEVYACPGCEDCRSKRGNPWRLPGENCTNYFVVVGDEAGLMLGSGRKITEIKDGTSRTILVVEAADRSVNWMAPEDLSLDEAAQLLSNPQAQRHVQRTDNVFTTRFLLGGGNVGFADGHVQYLTTQRADIARSMLTIDKGDLQNFQSNVLPRTGSETLVIIRWGHVFSFAVFVVLALAPALRKKQPEEAAA